MAQRPVTLIDEMRRLHAEEIEAYDVLDNDLAERVRILRVRLLPFGAQAMALGRFVLLRIDDDRSGGRKLLAHELVHVRQWHEAGCWAFVRAYLGDYFREFRSLRRHRDAYLSIGAERKARAEADAWESRRAPSR